MCACFQDADAVCVLPGYIHLDRCKYVPIHCADDPAANQVGVHK